MRGYGAALRIIPAMSSPSVSRALFRVDQVRRIDQAAIATASLAGTELMQRAATAAFSLLRRRWPDARRLAVVAGSGNNGGDAFLLATMARAEGMEVSVVAMGASSHGDAAQARASWLDGGGRIMVADEGTALPPADVLVDGLLGTGLARAPEGVAAALIRQMNGHAGRKLALDVPSGLDADHGVAHGEVLRADATISFVGWKRGLFTADGPDCCGALQLDTLRIPDDVYLPFEHDAELLDTSLPCLLPPRAANVNKGRFGHVLAIGGEHGMAGAIALCAEAALRVGAGLVSVATREAHVAMVNGRRPELMARGVDGPQALQTLLDRSSVLALGPGLGQEAWGHALWDAAIHAHKPAVIDADALNLLARESMKLPSGSVLTPHPGEAARLLDTDIASIQADRFTAARALAARYSTVVVLKGAGSLVADVDGRVALCPFGNPGMASAGMGDVLTGVIAGLMAQGLPAWDAARLGVLAHAISGDRAAGACPRGLIASDLLVHLRAFVNGCDT